jgi:hypothetical protein
MASARSMKMDLVRTWGRNVKPDELEISGPPVLANLILREMPASIKSDRR